MVQGTSQNGAMRIAKNGFGITASKDDGYYGRGIYFTSYLKYASCYAQKTPNDGKIFLLSAVIPGNPYPVAEHPFSVDENGKILESMNATGEFTKVLDPHGLYGQVSSLFFLHHHFNSQLTMIAIKFKKTPRPAKQDINLTTRWSWLKMQN